jgi:hypothetical protein
MGFRMVTISTDLQLLIEAATLRFDEVREGLKGQHV